MRQKDEMERTENARARSNRHILWLTYGIAALFIAMAVYFGWFIQFKSENVIGSSYNARLDLLSDRVTRGSIMSNDKTVLAQTNVASDGSEKRYYPYDYLFVHSVGYSGKNGKTGLESLANFYLLSSHVNLIEKTINEFQGKKNLGDNVITTLDVDLQQTASDAIGKHRGAVIVMEPDTGKILTMVSQPNFNANLVDERWAELVSPDNTKAQLVNRATQGLYPPGSTFKIITALEYIREYDADSYSYHCTGSAYIQGGTSIPCFDNKAHGTEDLKTAFANSCNSAFSTIGTQLNRSAFKNLCSTLMFNSNLPIGIEYNSSSFTLDDSSGISEAQETAIGQGKTMMTPIHNLMITAAIANDGVMMTPYLVDHVQTADKIIVEQTTPTALATVATADEAEQLTQYMRAVVTQGTGYALKNASYKAAGKTGSAQYDSSDNVHSWFVGFAPYDDPEVAICVILEGGYTGVRNASYVAKEVLDAYFN